jgi:cysteine desulfurase family protein (TIGR01976 family)
VPQQKTNEISLRLRAHVPAVLFGQTRGWKFFDGPSGTQMVDGCLDAMRDYMLTGVANRKEIAPTGDQTEQIIGRARQEFQRFLNAPGYRVVFGQNMTSLAFAFAHAIARHRAREGSSILISELEHFGNVDPWVQNFADHGVDAVFLPVDPDTCRLDDDAMAREFSDRNVDLVAVTLAANAIGTVPDVAKIVAQAHEAGALAAVDGVHAVPHLQVDLEALGPDIFFCSAYKFYGPHLGMALVKEELAEELQPYKVTPAATFGPEKFETGSQNHEAIAGLAGTLDTLASLVGGAGGDGAREAIGELSRSQASIADWIEDQLRAMPKVRLFRASRAAGALAPTIAFRVEGRTPLECAERLRERGLFITHGDLYVVALARRLGVADDGGWARLGVAGYNRMEEAEELVDAIGAL